MKRIFISAIVISCIIGYSCKPGAADNRNPGNDATKKEWSKADSANKEAMQVHDEVMPKLNLLVGYEKKAQNRVDSLENLIKQKSCKCEDLHDMVNNYSKLFLQLKTAEKGMMDWMEGYNPEPKLENEEQRIAYFEDQKIKAEKMKGDFFTALDKAKLLLGD